ncbi:Uncharacterised protein [Bordetella pertussis]|nr:Uncharacterised protein [Bordetella pertussis]
MPISRAARDTELVIMIAWNTPSCAKLGSCSALGLARPTGKGDIRGRPRDSTDRCKTHILHEAGPVITMVFPQVPMRGRIP